MNDSAGPSRRSEAAERGFCGSIDLRLEGDGIAEVGFGLHPAARGRSIMTAALQLVCGYGFEVAGLQVIRWRAVVGNWASRRVAAKVGFVFDGAVRRLLVHRGELLDGWIATLTREDPRSAAAVARSRSRCAADGVQLRAFRSSDVDRIVEACSDPRTAYWLVSMPRPYRPENALAYLESTASWPRAGPVSTWCIADPEGRPVPRVDQPGRSRWIRQARRDRLLGASRCARSRRRDGGCPAGDRAREGLRVGDVAADSLRLEQHGVATGGRTGRLYERSGSSPPRNQLATAQLADLVLYSRP